MRLTQSLALLCAAASTIALASPSLAQTQARVTAASETQPTVQGGANMAVMLPGVGGARVLGTGELGGLELYDLSGKRLASMPAGEVVGVDARAGFPLGGAAITLIAAADSTTNSLRFFSYADGSLAEVGARPVPLGFAVENLCLFHSPQDGAFYTFAVGDGGEIDQHMVFATADGRVGARQVRRINVPSTAEHCVADDASSTLYVSEQAVGIWRFSADPESDPAPTLVDLPRLGKITEEAGGIALYDTGGGRSWLIASDASAGRLNIYDRTKEDAYVGSLALAAPGGAGVKEPGGLNASALPLGTQFPRGALAIADEEAEGGANYKLIAMDALAAAAGLDLGEVTQQAAFPGPQFPVVHARVETKAVRSSGDAADDPAIWANRADPAASLIIGTDKKGGLDLYDMQGNLLQFVPDGKMNNVDLREGFRLGGKEVVLVTTSDRTNKAVGIYVLDTAARRLINVADGIQPSGLSDPYGLCMYRGRRGKYYVFISDPDGLVRQWELMPTAAGKVRARQVRDVKFASQTEGCVADDANGRLYVGEEDVALWRLGAEPGDGAKMSAVDTVERNARIKDDLEGVGLYDLGNGRGYLVVSSQGNDSYAVYRREGDNAYLGSFSVVANGGTGIDGVSETDGLDVISLPLGEGFEHGAMVAQDGRNVLPSENQNFKYVSWSDIAAALKLETR